MRHVERHRCEPDNLHHFYERQQKSYVFYHFFRCTRPPGLRLCMKQLKNIEHLAAFNARSKEKEGSIPLLKDIESK